MGLRHSAQRKVCTGVCYKEWSADEKYMYLSPTNRFSKAESNRSTYIVPVQHGVEQLNLPASGIDLSRTERLAGFQSIPQANMSPGPDPRTYAFTTKAFRGNLFRIPLH